jgi:hypothetical protein
MIKDIVPIKEKQLIIRIPEDQELYYKVLNIRTGPTVSEVKGMKEYTFYFSGLSDYQQLWGTDYEALPRLFFSTTKDFERAYFPFVAQPAFTYRVNDAMANMAEKIRKESDDDLKAILAIQKMVVNDIGSWNLPLEYAGFSCRTPEETWNSNAGTAIEKTVLLATLLMQADFNAVPVAIIPQKYYDRNVGSLYMFEDFAVQVRLGPELIYLSATSTSSQDLSYSSTGNIFLVLDGAIESLKTYESENVYSVLNYFGDLVLDAEGKLTGKVSVRLEGNINPYFSLYLDSAYIKRFAPGVKNAEIRQISKAESTAFMEMETKADFQKAGYIMVDIPASGYGIASLGFSYIESNRQSPIKFRESIDEQYQYDLYIPENLVLINPAESLEIENEVGVVNINIKQEGNRVTIKRKIILKKSTIAYDQFDALTDLWNAWENPVNNRLAFKTTD